MVWSVTIRCVIASIVWGSFSTGCSVQSGALEKAALRDGGRVCQPPWSAPVKVATRDGYHVYVETPQLAPLSHGRTALLGAPIFLWRDSGGAPSGGPHALAGIVLDSVGFADT